MRCRKLYTVISSEVAKTLAVSSYPYPGNSETPPRCRGTAIGGRGLRLALGCPRMLKRSARIRSCDVSGERSLEICAFIFDEIGAYLGRNV